MVNSLRLGRWACAAIVLQGGLMAQNGSLRGLVTDQFFDDIAIPGVTVTILELDLRVKADDQGNYVFPSVPAGTYTVVFSKSGYTSQPRRNVPIVADRQRTLNVSLAAELTEMDELVVEPAASVGGSDEESLLGIRIGSAAVLDAVSSNLMSQAGVSDAAGALRLVAGATVKDGKSAVIRGLPDRYVSSQVNLVRLPSSDDDKRAVELDQFPSAVVDSVQVSKTFTPDQQSDASGGAVNVRLRGIPEEEFFFRYKGQLGYNSQVRRRSDFLSYDGGGVTFFGQDDGRRDIQDDNIGLSWDGAVGVSREDAPIDYKWSASIGGNRELDRGIKVGGIVNFFYERDSAFRDNEFADDYWVESPGAPLTPRTSQGTPEDGDFQTNLFDITRGSRSVQWGVLGAMGIEVGENHALNAVYLHSHTAEDNAILAEDTRGKQFFFPGYDPNDPTTPGHSSIVRPAAPYLRFETLEYTERTTSTFQLSGRHAFPVEGFGPIRAPEIEWTYAVSSAEQNQPDKRQFASAWLPERVVGTLTIPAQFQTLRPAANINLGNLQRIYRRIEEESDQFTVSLKLPFETWTENEGFLKFGIFRDEVTRTFDQENFTNSSELNALFPAQFDEFWSATFPFENHPLEESEFDVDYEGRQKIDASYIMLDLPVLPSLKFVGGVRFEDVELSIQNEAEADANFYDPVSRSVATLQGNEDIADADLPESNTLPAISLQFTPVDEVTFRASYTETVARQTFKEVTPVIQQEFLGGPVFIGNPALTQSEVKNYDLRVDYRPYEGGLFSASWFRKDITDAIEYTQQVTAILDEFTFPENYPDGRLSGIELETRQPLGQFLESLDGLSLGANATFIDSEVTLTEFEQQQFDFIGSPISTREMTSAPDYLYNLYLTYDVPYTGTSLGLFYTVQGETLVVGAGQDGGNLIPDIYAAEFENLNFSLRQPVGNGFVLQFQAKNLTNPDIETFYRSQYIDSDVTRSSFTRGVEYSISIGGEVVF